MSKRQSLTPEERINQKEWTIELNSGSEHAFNMLYLHNKMLIKSVVARVLERESDIEEIVSDAFLQLWENRGSYDPEKEILGWLIIVARRRALDRIIRITAFHRAHTNLEMVTSEGSLEAACLTNKQLEENELHEFFNELPPEQARCVELSLVNGLSQREIALVVAAPLGTVKTRIELGLQKLKRLYEGQPMYIRRARA
jgi:RNA polymerase sigma-70 factor (ECF subfamily)